MKLHRLFAPVLIGLAVLTGCGPKPAAKPPVSAPAPAPAVDPVHGHLLQAQPKLPTVKVLLGNPSERLQEMTAEIASKSVEISTGMMFRTNMAETEAMLFIFSNAAPRNFYMRNCTVPLSAAYISPEGEILQIIDLQPHDERGVPSLSDNIQFVLEVPQGWFKRHNVTVGGIVRTETASLKEIDVRKIK